MATKYVGVSCIIYDEITNSVLWMKRSEKCRHSFNKWAFPGGGMEQVDLSIEHCVKRECREEIGVDVKVIGCLGILEEYLPQYDTYWMDIVTLCKLDGCDPEDVKNEEPEKCLEMKWVSCGGFLPEPIATNCDRSYDMFVNYLVERDRDELCALSYPIVPIETCIIED